MNLDLSDQKWMVMKWKNEKNEKYEMEILRKNENLKSEKASNDKTNVKNHISDPMFSLGKTNVLPPETKQEKRKNEK